MTVRQTYGTERLGALSDGVFAIILTLLVLELKVPELSTIHGEAEMIRDLEEQIPHFVAWIISFILVARIWVVHHKILAHLGRCHVGTMIWNFALLCVASLIPFGASLIGTYEWDPVAIVVFGSIFGVNGIFLGLLARHAEREKELHHERTEPDDLRRQGRYQMIVLPMAAVVSFAAIPVSQLVAVSIWLVEPVIALMIAGRGGRAEQRGGA